MGKPFGFPYPAEQFQAIHHGHADICNYQGNGWLRLQNLKGFLAIFGRKCSAGEVFEACRHQRECCPVVIDEKYHGVRLRFFRSVFVRTTWSG